jgi:hypothetical protein
VEGFFIGEIMSLLSQYNPSSSSYWLNQIMNPGPGGAFPIAGGVPTSKTSSAPVVKQNGGWYDGVQYWEPGQGPSTSSSSSSSDNGGGGSAPNIDDVYQPYINFLNGEEVRANTEAQAADTQVDNEYAANQKALSGQYGLTKSGMEAQTQEFKSTEQSALEEALRNYNNLKQRTMSRFGGGSSTGEAMGELAQQEFFKNQGAVQKQFSSDMSKLVLQQQQLDLQFSSASDQLRLQHESAINDIGASLRQNLSAIAAKKAETESNKTAQRYAALEAANNQKKELELTFKLRSADLKEKMATLQASVTNNFSALLKISQDYDRGAYFQPASTMNISSQPIAANSSTYKPRTTDDEFSEFENPFI